VLATAVNRPEATATDSHGVFETSIG